MIASLEGQLAAHGADHVVLVVGGVGFKVSVPLNSPVGEIGATLFLHTLMIVREDAISLYGFPSVPERELFERLISVSGVGPKLALAILGGMTSDRLRTAVASNQPEAFTRISGIGRKTAEKIIFELKDKLKGADGLIAATAGADVNKDVYEALLGFGYTPTDAQAAIRAIPQDAPNTFEDRIRLALQYFM
jgi:Holliday junction DNA helicase RuvA